MYGRQYEREQLLARVGDISQLAGVKPYTLAEGRAAGVSAIDFRTGAGFAFTVLPDRAMDISYAEWQGIPLGWRSQTGDVHSAYYEPEGFGWLRSFSGGLLATCGLTQAGFPCQDGGESLGLHGRIGNVPATNVWADGAWEGDDYRMWARGKMREASVFGANIELTRQISARMGETRLFIEDTVENLAFEPSPHLIIYHINIGFPIVDDGSRIVIPSRKVTPRDDVAATDITNHSIVYPPRVGFAEQVYFHQLVANDDGQACFGITNKGFDGGRGIGIYVKCHPEQLPNIIEWKMNGAGTYVIGIEPMNGAGAGGRCSERENGTLPVLAPREIRKYELEIGVLTSASEVEAFEQGLW
jgi:hypothetical protein